MALSWPGFDFTTLTNYYYSTYKLIKLTCYSFIGASSSLLGQRQDVNTHTTGGSMNVSIFASVLLVPHSWGSHEIWS